MTKGKTMKVQRNPECMIVNCAPPIELVAKVRTAIAGRMVPWWTRAGHKPSKRKRQMGVSTFFIEAVAKAVEGVVPSPENLAWAEEMRAKGRENHAIATRERWEKRRAKRRQRQERQKPECGNPLYIEDFSGVAG